MNFSNIIVFSFLMSISYVMALYPEKTKQKISEFLANGEIKNAANTAFNLPPNINADPGYQMILNATSDKNDYYSLFGILHLGYLTDLDVTISDKMNKAIINRKNKVLKMIARQILKQNDTEIIEFFKHNTGVYSFHIKKLLKYIFNKKSGSFDLVAKFLSKLNSPVHEIEAFTALLQMILEKNYISHSEMLKIAGRLLKLQLLIKDAKNELPKHYLIDIEDAISFLPSSLVDILWNPVFIKNAFSRKCIQSINESHVLMENLPESIDEKKAFVWNILPFKSFENLFIFQNELFNNLALSAESVIGLDRVRRKLCVDELNEDAKQIIWEIIPLDNKFTYFYLRNIAFNEYAAHNGLIYAHTTNTVPYKNVNDWTFQRSLQKVDDQK